MMKFSVIVPTYNSEKYITELLNSLAKQDFPKTEFEVVVVDDCSTDQTLQIVEK
ncbi:glycosyl transferase [Staphylococcus aureus]|uniref:Glycosyl transferase n=5 Tax=Staphylococcus aureus TaxID=1280 RepID=A0A380DL42_STAAU|nr:glycosyl transferase [Staphylococcus aureus]